MREEIDKLKGKVEEVVKEFSVRPKNMVEEGRSGNGIEWIRLIMLELSEEGKRKGEWIKVKERGSKKV